MATPRFGLVTSLWRIYPFVRPRRARLITSFVVALTASLLTLLIPQVLRWMVDGPLAAGDAAQVWVAVGLIAALGITEPALWALRRWLALAPAATVEGGMRFALYSRLQQLPVSFHDRWPSGQLLSRALSDVGTTRRWIAFGLVFLVVNVLFIIVGTAVLLSMSLLLGLVFLVVSAPMWIIGYRFEQKYSRSSRRSQDQAGDLATAVEESVHGIRILKAFGRGEFSLRRFTDQANSLRSTELTKAKLEGSIWWWLILLPNLALGLILIIGVAQAATGAMTVGELFAFFATATVLRWPIESIGFLYAFTVDTRTAVDRIMEVLDEENPIADPQSPRRIASPQGQLVFDNVVFRYPDAAPESQPLLAGVSLELAPGESVALVGLTGCGKSTLTALTMRLFDVTSGAIRLDGVDLRELSRADLRKYIGMAFEEPTLFSASVRQNVLLGRPDLEAGSVESERVLAQALEISQAQFVYDLPEGLDTTIGEEGLSLSGGQRQRLALARAVAADPAVLVLDDPLSALDVSTEALVEAALRDILRKTTALIVAHRPSTVMLADRVALLHEGRILDVGTHSELLGRSAAYRYVLSSFDDEPRLAEAEEAR